MRFGSEFWAANYAKIKEANMKLPILVRESSNTPAKLTATYGAHCSNAALRFSPLSGAQREHRRVRRREVRGRRRHEPS